MFNKIITVDGQKYRVQYNPGTKDVFFKGTKQLKNERALEQLFEQLVKKNAQILGQGKTVTVQETAFQEQLKEATLPDPKKANEPHKPMDVPGRAKVTFEFDSEVHPLDELQPPRKNQKPTFENANKAAEELRQAARSEPNKKALQETRDGVHLGMAPRQNYRMNVALQGGMKTYFDRPSFVSTDLFAKNSPLAQGAITSSFNRYADTVTMMRAVAAQDGSIDYYTGRVDNLKKAQEMATFMFQAESLGLPTDPEEVYVFPFAVQSLLSMTGGERTMYEQEVAAYRELAKDPVNVCMPDGKIARVRFKPICIAANQFNYMNTAEKLLPEALSGKAAADAVQKDQNFYFRTYAREVWDELDPATRIHVQDALYFLEHADELKPWQVIMNRAYLCHLLKLPLVVHCKSSVDRTGIAGAMITAMTQWLQAGCRVPQVSDRFAIHEIVNIRINSNGKEQDVPVDGQVNLKHYEPFRELFAYAVTKELKCTELSRSLSGYKWYQGIGQHPALVDLLPRRYFKEDLSYAGAFAILLLSLLQAIGVILLAAISPLLPIVFMIKERKRLQLSEVPALLLATLTAPFKILHSYFSSDVFSSLNEYQLNESLGLLEPKGAASGA